jgi:hypothetical protein
MIGIFVIALPLVIYVVGAVLAAPKQVTHPDDFFVAFRRVGVTAFATSSIAYAFQVSTIYPFLNWGASQSYFVPVVNTICWGLGILLFYLSFEKYKDFIGTDLTLHGFLGTHYGGTVRVVASWLTLVGFLGYAIAECYFGSQVLSALISHGALFYGVMFAVIAIVLFYVCYGGQLSSIRTDQLQLVFSYVGIFGLFVYFFYLLLIHSPRLPGALMLGLLVLLIYIPSLLHLRRFKFIAVSENETGTTRTLNGLINFVVSAALGLMLLGAVLAFLKLSSDRPARSLITLEGFGIAGLASLVILPLGWQFVDLTNWQRLLSVKPTQKDSLESIHSNIRRGLLTYAVESPFTWILFLVFGALAVVSFSGLSGADLLITLPKQLLESGNRISNIFGYIFIISIISIMLSTVDSFIMGMMFAFIYDTNPRSRRVLDSKEAGIISSNTSGIINVGRRFGIVALLVGTLFFAFFDKVLPKDQAGQPIGGTTFITLLLTFYTAQLSFLPITVGALFIRRQIARGWVIASMVGGAAAGISLGIYSVVWRPELSWYPILVSFLVSWSIYLIGLSVSSKTGSAVRSFYAKSSFSLTTLIIAICFSFVFSIRGPFRRAGFSWEIAGFFSTIAYSSYLYIVNGMMKGRKFMFESTYRRDRVALVFICLFALSVATFLSLQAHLHMVNISWFDGVVSRYPTESKMLCLWIASMLFAWTVRILGKDPARDDVTSSFDLSFKYSDGPLCVIFFVLMVYAMILGEREIESGKMASFFAGAVAFQMLLSNVIWVFLDDPLLAKQSRAAGVGSGSTIS